MDGLASEGYRIRQFRVEDLERVMEINFECLPENYSPSFYLDLHKRFPETFLVAELDGRIQGYVMSRIEKGFSKFHMLRPTRLCHIVSIAVREPYRRRGIGTELLRCAMRNGREVYEAEECYLEVRVTNEPAIRLYQKLGFVRVKRNVAYYMDGEDAWVYANPLNEIP
ncbi:MAG: N-acetyltransferase [Candidatus Bathyarchaeia archaeon]